MLLWIAVMWVVIGYAIWRGWGPYIRSKRSPKIKVGAVISGKSRPSEFNPLTGALDGLESTLIFDCEDGVIRDYNVHDDIFDLSEVGDDGVLTYQGDHFVVFDARRPRHDLDKLQKRLMRG